MITEVVCENHVESSAILCKGFCSYVVKIWSDFKYGSTDPWILDSLNTRKYDFYILTDIDLPWQPDPLREHPEKRKELFSLYEKYLTDRELPFYIVTGQGNTRLRKAISRIEKLDPKS